MAEINKVILLHTNNQSTESAKQADALTGSTFTQGELAIVTTEEDESILIKNSTGTIVDFPTTAKVDKKIQTVTDTVEKNKVVAGDSSINVATSGTNTEISVKIKTEGNALKLDDSEGLYVDESVLTTYSGNNAITVSGEGATKVIELKINANDKTLAQDVDGLKTTFSLKKLADAGDQAAKYQLWGSDNQPIGDTIDIPKDQFLKSVSYSADTHQLVFVFETTTGESTLNVDVTDLVDTYTAGDGLSGDTSGDSVKFSVKIDAAGETKYLSVGPDGLKLSGIDEAISAAVETETNRATAAEDKIEASVGLAADGSHVTTGGNYTSGATTIAGEIAALDAQVKANTDAISGLTGSSLTGITVNGVTGTVESNVASVTINGAQILLDGYTQATGTTEEELTIAASDSVNVALGKLSKTVEDNEKVVAAALTQLKETLGVTGETGEYTPNASSTYISGAASFNDADAKLDAAIKANADKISQIESSESGIEADVTALKGALGITGETIEYTANAGTEYISGATSFNDADVKLDAAVKANADKIEALEAAESQCLTGITSTGSTVSVGEVSAQSVNVEVNVAGIISAEANNAISSDSTGKLYLSTTIDCGTF